MFIYFSVGLPFRLSSFIYVYTSVYDVKLVQSFSQVYVYTQAFSDVYMFCFAY